MAGLTPRAITSSSRRCCIAASHLFQPSFAIQTISSLITGWQLKKDQAAKRNRDESGGQGITALNMGLADNIESLKTWVVWCLLNYSNARWKALLCGCLSNLQNQNTFPFRKGMGVTSEMYGICPILRVKFVTSKEYELFGNLIVF